MQSLELRRKSEQKIGRLCDCRATTEKYCLAKQMLAPDHANLDPSDPSQVHLFYNEAAPALDQISASEGCQDGKESLPFDAFWVVT